MILQLIIKDLRAYKQMIFIRILVLWLSFGALFFAHFYKWDVYMMHASMCIAFACTFFTFSEKYRNTEILTISLPVTKNQIVLAKYLTSLTIIVAGITIWYIIAFIASVLTGGTFIPFDQILKIKTLFIVLFFLCTHVTIFFPFYFSTRVIGLVLGFAIAFISAIALTAVIFLPYSRMYNHYFSNSDISFVVSLTALILIAFIVSINLSVFVYRRHQI